MTECRTVNVSQNTSHYIVNFSLFLGVELLQFRGAMLRLWQQVSLVLLFTVRVCSYITRWQHLGGLGIGL